MASKTNLKVSTFKQRKLGETVDLMLMGWIMRQFTHWNYPIWKAPNQIDMDLNHPNQHNLNKKWEKLYNNEIQTKLK